MRRSVKASSDSCGTADRVKDDGSRALAVCACYLDLRIGVLRITERVEEKFDIAETKLDGDSLVSQTQ